MPLLVHRILTAVAVWCGACLVPAAAQTAVSATTPLRPAMVAAASLSAADTGWMMTSTVLVLLMTLPGVALFYAGMVRRKNVLNTMACVVAIAALVSLLGAVLGGLAGMRFHRKVDKAGLGR